MKRSIILSVLVLILLTSCPLLKNQSKNGSLTIVSWNVQNIFNAEKDGNEYSEYLPSSGWTEKAYQKRLTNLSTVCSYDVLANADVFVFNEVENSSVVEDIISLDQFRKNGFMYYAAAGETDGAINTAVVSRIPITDVKIHSVSDCRPILQVELQNDGEHVFVLAIHAKSNLEGVSETAPLRLALGKALKKVVSEIEKNYPGSLIIIAGDFNESYTEKNMMSDSRSGFSNCPLNLLPTFKEGYFFNFWLDSSSQLQAQGSYCYKNEWKCYDNILVSYEGNDESGWEYESGGVVFHGILQTTDNKPNSFRRDLLTGVSDHLPVWVSFSPT